MALDPKDFSTSGAVNPGANAAAVSFADTDMAQRSRAIYVGGAGDLVVKMAQNEEIVTFYNVAAGSMLPIRVTQVRVATTATNVVAVW